MSTSVEDIGHTLTDVTDPELGIDVVSLGMIEKTELADGHATIFLRETFLSCIAVPIIKAEIVAKLARAGVEADVRTGMAWSGELVSPRGRERLAELGIVVDTGGALSCPYCSSHQVQLDSAFGSAPCRAGYSCESCGTPFDVMRSPAVRAQRGVEVTGS